MKNKISTIHQNKLGTFFIETPRSVILKKATPPVSGFKTRREAAKCARMFGYTVQPVPPKPIQA